MSTQISKKTEVEDLDNLKTRITKGIELIKKETFCDVFLEAVKRLNFCINVKGDTFEGRPECRPKEFSSRTFGPVQKIHRKFGPNSNELATSMVIKSIVPSSTS
jgi:hypothetical protein